MPVQVIIKRKIHVDNPKALIPLLTELRDHAKAQPGYISGQTLKNIDLPEEYLVVSTWETAAREHFARFAADGEPILCIHPSSKVSGTVRSASVARRYGSI